MTTKQMTLLVRVTQICAEYFNEFSPSDLLDAVSRLNDVTKTYTSMELINFLGDYSENHDLRGVK